MKREGPVITIEFGDLEEALRPLVSKVAVLWDEMNRENLPFIGRKVIMQRLESIFGMPIKYHRGLK